MIKLPTFLVFSALIIALTMAQSPRRIGRGSENMRARAPRRQNRFPFDAECQALTFRSITGRCTTRVDPVLGEARRPLFTYLDVKSTEFMDMSLPSARLISNVVAKQEGRTENSQGLNDMFTFFGQFVDHDFALSPESELHETANIQVPANDPTLDGPELEFVRSERALVNASSSDVRPFTTLTSALDLSNVYGSDEMRNIALRVTDSCRLKTGDNELLPRNTEDFLNSPDTSSEFFFAGDTRSNENPVLTAMHTIWVREHNRLCDAVENAFPRTNSSTQYEIARAINIAEYQKIVYEEWLPAILGDKQLSPYRGYRRNVDPTVSIEFTTAGFRMGHTLVGADLARRDDNGNQLPSFPSEDQFFVKASEISSEEIDNLLRGASTKAAEEFDERAVDLLRNMLFENVEQVEGFDLIALNLQRSRDHNVPKFNQLRKHFLGSSASSFEAISSNSKTSANLREAYEHVENVEAWIGLMAEDKDTNVGVGRTLAELLVTEFERLRDGDQFFYLRHLRRTKNLRLALRRIEGIANEIMAPGPLFNSILLRTTGISPTLLNVDRTAFRV